jgi:hypothetical protein
MKELIRLIKVVMKIFEVTAELLEIALEENLDELVKM